MNNSYTHIPLESTWDSKDNWNPLPHPSSGSYNIWFSYPLDWSGSWMLCSHNLNVTVFLWTSNIFLLMHDVPLTILYFVSLSPGSLIRGVFGKESLVVIFIIASILPSLKLKSDHKWHFPFHFKYAAWWEFSGN